MRFLEFSFMLGMQLKIMYFTVYTPFSFMILQNLVLDNVIEHDRIFVFVYVNFLSSCTLECELALDQGVLGVSTKGVENKKLFVRGSRAV